MEQIATKKYNIDLTQYRESNPDNEWYFPIRMENSKGIFWVKNIVEALSNFKKPITQIAWDNCLRRGMLDADTPSETHKLRQWWTEGWKHTPPLEASCGAIPIMQVAEQPLGKTLEVVYPNLYSAAANFIQDKRTLRKFLQKQTTKQYLGVELIPLRTLEAAEPEILPWTLFAADNTIEKHFASRTALAEYLHIRPKELNWLHAHCWNELANGRWFWHDQWGLIPISPKDEPLDCAWRETRLPNYSGEEI